MPRYFTRPATARRAAVSDDCWSDAETEGREVYDDGSWSEDQPTGLLAPDGEMIWRCGRSIGFLVEG